MYFSEYVLWVVFDCQSLLPVEKITWVLERGDSLKSDNLFSPWFALDGTILWTDYALIFQIAFHRYVLFFEKFLVYFFAQFFLHFLPFFLLVGNEGLDGEGDSFIGESQFDGVGAQFED